MNLNIWQQVRWFLTEETVLHCYIVTLLHCTKIFLAIIKPIVHGPGFLPEFMNKAHVRFPFNGFMLVTTHEHITVS